MFTMTAEKSDTDHMVDAMADVLGTTTDDVRAQLARGASFDELGTRAGLPASAMLDEIRAQLARTRPIGFEALDLDRLASEIATARFYGA